MNSNYKKDPRPNRRKDKYNPYEIFSVGIETEDPHFYVKFVDVHGVTICQEINQDMFMLLDKFELEDLSFMNEVDNHYDDADLSDEVMAERLFIMPETTEATAYKSIQHKLLYEAILTLPAKQRRRLTLYYFSGLTYEEIAEIEGCTHPAIIKSVNKGIEKIRKFFRNRGYNLPD